MLIRIDQDFHEHLTDTEKTVIPSFESQSGLNPYVPRAETAFFSNKIYLR